jgi:hypothetical protein
MDPASMLLKKEQHICCKKTDGVDCMVEILK